MTDISAIKTALHEGIEVSDERLLRMMFLIMEDYNRPLAKEGEISYQRKALIHRERQRYLRGEGKSFTWDEVKSSLPSPVVGTMSYNIEIRPPAVVEILEAYDWYENQKDGLGQQLLETINAFYDVLQQNPVIHSYYEAPVRQGSLHRFPYVVMYEVIGEQIVVYNVSMTDRDPAKKRVG